MVKQGAIGASILFIVGIYFAIPNEANIGYMIVEALAESPAPETFLYTVPLFKLAFNILGIAMIIGSIFYIATQIKKSNIL